MIPVRGKAQSSIMHHKFAIVDSRIVIYDLSGIWGWDNGQLFHFRVFIKSLVIKTRFIYLDKLQQFSLYNLLI